jgi:uncharacterized caspase-like protein
VIAQTDLGKNELLEAMRAFGKEAFNADWAMVYHAGHGIELAGHNYLVPTDAKFESDRDVQYEGVPLEHVINAVTGAKKLRLVVLDACRDTPFLQKMTRTILSSRALGRGLAQIDPEGGTLVAYTANHGQVPLDGDGQNSPSLLRSYGRCNTRRRAEQGSPSCARRCAAGHQAPAGAILLWICG